MKIYAKDLLEAAHRHSSDHRLELERSTACGCFYCVKSFAAIDVTEWVDDGATALCPKCGIDSVVGSASGYPVEEPRFLGAMRRLYF